MLGAEVAADRAIHAILGMAVLIEAVRENTDKIGKLEANKLHSTYACAVAAIGALREEGKEAKTMEGEGVCVCTCVRAVGVW